jgi:hypothetical protein
MTDETNYAFPYQYKSAPDQLTVCLGMTLRDYFAAKAMQGSIAMDGLPSHHVKDFLAEQAYLMADAMLKSRKK